MSVIRTLIFGDSERFNRGLCLCLDTGDESGKHFRTSTSMNRATMPEPVITQHHSGMNCPNSRPASELTDARLHVHAL